MSTTREPLPGECWRRKRGHHHALVLAVTHAPPLTVERVYFWHASIEVMGSEHLGTVLALFERCTEHPRKRGGEA